MSSPRRHQLPARLIEEQWIRKLEAMLPRGNEIDVRPHRAYVEANRIGAGSTSFHQRLRLAIRRRTRYMRLASTDVCGRSCPGTVSAPGRPGERDKEWVQGWSANLRGFRQGLRRSPCSPFFAPSSSRTGPRRLCRKNDTAKSCFFQQGMFAGAQADWSLGLRSRLSSESSFGVSRWFLWSEAD